MPGFSGLPGLGMLGHHSLPHCPGTVRDDPCRLRGSQKELAAACLARPDCTGFVYSPLGRDDVDEPLGKLKASGHVGM